MCLLLYAMRVFLQLAAQLYPGHTLLLLPATTTSSIQAALNATWRAAATSQPQQQQQALKPVLVVLTSTTTSSSSSSKGALRVDRALRLKSGQTLVLATPAALAAAAAAAAAGPGPSLEPGELWAVDCGASKDGGFISARRVTV
jgi:hypothetical protein